MNDPIITIDDVAIAAKRLQGLAVRTPMIENEALNDRLDARVMIKPECLQRSGSFKFRGAYNRLSAMTEEEKARGVVAFSSGNHAQGVAMAARLLGIHAAIVMPSDAPKIKVARTERDGAEVITYDRFTGSREGIAREICQERGAVLVPSFDDPYIMAGQGTVGYELAQDLAAMGMTPDFVTAPCGGGGLMSGIATAMRATFPDVGIVTVEPAGYDDTARSFASGVREENDMQTRTICDALLAEMPGKLTFAVNHGFGASGVAVTDEEVHDAMCFAVEELKLVVEPGGAVALAALLSGKIDAKGKIVALVLSGGNVDPDLLSGILGGA